MLQNPEAKKKLKYQLRPPGAVAWSRVSAPDFGRGTSGAGIGFELTVTPWVACSSLADVRRLQGGVTCRGGNESHSAFQFTTESRRHAPSVAAGISRQD